jgi:hypothetical protein
MVGSETECNAFEMLLRYSVTHFETSCWFIYDKYVKTVRWT